MFIEPGIDQSRLPHAKPIGWIEVVCGSMFSGKTEELIRRLNRALIANQRVEIFKPAIDTRYHVLDVVSHNANSIRSTPVQFASDIMLLAGNSDVVGIDEAQFFDTELIAVSRKLANAGKRVIIAGLDMDFRGEPFGPIPGLMGIAEYVTKVRAICMKCGNLASYSFRLSDAKQKVMLGEQEAYEARCRKCFYEDFDPKRNA
ncbi:thymidine kinase [Reichenbachiella agarivorans]|uniref:Thymidine kinase n=1 Tax=Reichenbachiella agarivorans TaxID=2979464 RepID=A0ABY6CSU5_9BACT|nr:thymidine kinase [Reichenbachiella agarivorans]UXP33594.1 thymidine kinase [Reichenbachiella agarivorans]